MNRVEEYVRKVQIYIDSVMSGRRCAGKLEQLSVRRYLDDVKFATEKGIYFDEKKVRKAFAMFPLLKHYKGEWAGQELQLEGWQCFVVWNIFGWYRSGGVRRFNYAIIELARKNGKTTFAAAIALIMMLLDGEAGAEIYSAAVDKDQAAICFNAAVQMVKSSPALSKYVDIYRGAIVWEKTASSFKPLSKDSGNKDGLNPHCAICDERHAWQTDDIYNVIKSGMGARKQPLIFTITTAGFNTECPYFADRRVAIEILEGLKIQENEFVLIFSPDDGDDWKDRKTWEKASPNLGVSVAYEYMERELEDAVNKGGRTEVNFKTKNCNMWVDAPDVWIPDDLVKGCDHGVTDEDLIGQECYGGIDLASHVDLNAMALYFPKLKALKLFYWIPEGKVNERKDKVDYRRWSDEGYITITPGNVIDIDYQVADILKIVRRYKVVKIGFDPAKAYHGTIQGLQKGGLDSMLKEFGQGIRNMSEPTKKLEAMTRSQELDILRNPVLRWNYRNVMIYRDPNDNIKLDKRKSPDKIDGLDAAVDAIGVMMVDEIEGAAHKIYTNHSLRVIDFTL